MKPNMGRGGGGGAIPSTPGGCGRLAGGRPVTDGLPMTLTPGGGGGGAMPGLRPSSLKEN